MLRLYTLHAIGQYPKLRQPIGMHVSPGEIAEEVSVCLCSGGEYEVQGCGNSGLRGLSFIVVLLQTALEKHTVQK